MPNITTQLRRLTYSFDSRQRLERDVIPRIEELENELRKWRHGYNTITRAHYRRRLDDSTSPLGCSTAAHK